MNILVLGNGSLSVGYQEVKLCVEFAKLGHKVFLISNKGHNLFDVGKLPTHKNLQVLYIPFADYRFDLLDIEDKIDVCLGMDQSVSQFVAEYKNKTQTKSYCMFLDFPVHVIDKKDMWNYNFAYSQRYYYWISCALELDGIIFNNNVAVEEFYKRYKRDAHLVWYAISDDSYYSEVTSEATKDYIFGCHRLIKYKGTDYLFRALQKLPYHYKHAFVSGDDKHIQELQLLSQSIKNNVILHNRVSEERKMSMFYNAKLVVYPQITEWIGGLSIIEGMSVETPGICYDYGVLRELYDDCVLYARKKSVSDLREKIKQLYEDDDLNIELGKRGYKRFQKYFTREVMVKNLLKVFNK